MSQNDMNEKKQETDVAEEVKEVSETAAVAEADKEGTEAEAPEEAETGTEASEEAQEAMEPEASEEVGTETEESEDVPETMETEAPEETQETEPEASEEAEETDSESDEPGSLQKIRKAIRSYHRDEVAQLIKNHALDIASDEEKSEIAASIIALRDIRLVDLLSKEVKYFTPDMLELDFDNWNNREFIRQVLSKYRKNFNLEDDEICSEYFKIACEIGQTEVLSYMVSKKDVKSCYPMLASGTEDAFKVLRQVKLSDLDADLRVQIMYEAAISPDGQNRLEKLSALGYDLDEENSDEKNLTDLMVERVASGNYAKNRSGEVNRVRDKSIIQFLEKKRTHQFDQKEKKKFPLKKALPFIILAVIFLAILAYAIGYQIVS